MMPSLFVKEPGDGKEETPVKAESEKEANEEVVATELSRSERKCLREKKRRNDVNRGLDQLLSLVFEIDPEIKLEAEERVKKTHGVLTKALRESPLLSRLELVNHAIATLERVHKENEERKRVISHLSRGLLAGGGNPAPPAGALSSLQTSFDIQRQELLRRHQLELEALSAASRGAPPGLPPFARNDPTALGLGASLGGAASLPLDSTASSFLEPQRGHGFHSPLAPLGHQGLGGGLSTEQRALLKRRQAEEEKLALAAVAGLGVDRTAVAGASIFPKMNPALSSRLVADPPVQLSRDRIGQAMLRDHALATAAAGNSQGGMLSGTNPYEPPRKRLKDYS